MTEPKEERDWTNVGGTRGGLVSFLLGLAMLAGGGYMLTQSVQVVGGFWHFGGLAGRSSFGLTLLPTVVGVGFLFYNAKNPVGWVLTLGGALFIFLGIILNMNITMQSVTLYEVIIMLVCIFGGIGLVARAMFARPPDPQD